jgi:hypothetical protein
VRCRRDWQAVAVGPGRTVVCVSALGVLAAKSAHGVTGVATFILLADIGNQRFWTLHFDFQGGDQRVFRVNDNMSRFPLNFKSNLHLRALPISAKCSTLQEAGVWLSFIIGVAWAFRRPFSTPPGAAAPPSPGLLADKARAPAESHMARLGRTGLKQTIKTHQDGCRSKDPTPAAMSSPIWPCTDTGCSATVWFDPPTRTFAPRPAAIDISAEAPV